MQVLCATVDEFDHQEQQAIYYHHYLNLPPQTIAQVVELTEMHVISVLGLYAERLVCKINLFKRAKLGEGDDVMQVSDLLLPWGA